MKVLTFTDTIVYFGLVAWSIITTIELAQLLRFSLQLLASLPSILWNLLARNASLIPNETGHYMYISNPLQQLVINLLAYAFDHVDFRIGRLFFSSRVCLRFATWRAHGRVSFTSFVLEATKHHKAVQVYRFDGRKCVLPPERIILYVHGGGLIVGSVPFYAEFLTELALQCPSTVVLSPEYDLVPEEVYPTQMKQIYAVYRYIKSLWPDSALVLAGDSAGAGLCQTLLCALGEEVAGNIHKAVYISPWLDFTGAPIRRSGLGDYISPSTAMRYGFWYTKDNQASKADYGIMTDTRKTGQGQNNDTWSALPANPLRCSSDHIKRSCPSGGMLILAGGAECLLADAKRLVSIIGDMSKVALHIEPNEIHAYVLINLYLRRGSARTSGLTRILKFLESYETTAQQKAEDASAV